MDIFTQGLAGAVLAASRAKPQQVRAAAAVGFLAGMLADIDVLIRSADDALLFLDYHRHFTHALLFVPIGALVAALLAWPWARRVFAFPALYGFALLGYLPSGLLDACTSYGTHLFWPFTETRVAWRVISIIDPVFTLTLVLGLLVALVRRGAWPARVALGLALMYLALGTLQRERAEDAARALASSRGHAVERIIVHPSLGNVLLWRSLYAADGQYHVDAVRVGLWGTPRIYAGAAVLQFSPSQLQGLVPESVLARDIARFTYFSDGFVVRHPVHPDVLGDMRYALLPNSPLPLWGIRFELARPDQHVRFETFREHDARARNAFMSMLLGKDVPIH